MGQHREIELKFLVRELPEDIDDWPKIEIRQGYIPDGPNPLRVRKIGDKFELTKKIPDGRPGVSIENTIEITEEGFNKLWPLTVRTLEKTRQSVSLPDGHYAEVNRYRERLSPLVIVEVEFVSLSAYSEFKSPDWFGPEVTSEKIASNSYLAGKSYADIEPLLRRFAGK